MVRSYIVETNRAYGDNIRIAARRLERRGCDVEILPHKTSMVVIRPSDMSWDDFKNALRACINAQHGSLLVISQTTGRAYICSNRGNQRGVFQEVGYAA